MVGWTAPRGKSFCDRALVLFLILIELSVFCLTSPTLAEQVKPEDDAWKTELREALLNCQRAELSSLSPYRLQGEEKKKSYFGYKQLGSTSVEGDLAANLAKALQDDIDANTEGIAALCFYPRHGLSFGDYDLVICFQCFNTNVYKNKAYVGSVHPMGHASPLFVQTVQEKGLAWPGWHAERDFTRFSHAAGLRFQKKPEQKLSVRRMPVSDWLVFSSTLAIPENALLPKSEDQASTEQTFKLKHVQAEKFVDSLYRYLKGSYGYDPNNNSFSAHLTDEQADQVKELIKSLDQPEHAIVSVEVVPLMKKSKALKAVQGLTEAWEFSEIEFAEVQLPQFPLQVERAIRGEGKISGVQTQVTIGCASIGEAYLLFKATVPSAAERWGFVGKTLKQFETFPALLKSE